MEFKLQAISNNVDDNDTMTFHPDKLKNHQRETEENMEVEQVCEPNVPVLYSTMNGIHLRKYVKKSSTTTNSYQSSFCDLDRWNFRNNMESVGLTPPGNSINSDRASAMFRVVQAKPTVYEKEKGT